MSGRLFWKISLRSSHAMQLSGYLTFSCSVIRFLLYPFTRFLNPVCLMMIFVCSSSVGTFGLTLQWEDKLCCETAKLSQTACSCLGFTNARLLCCSYGLKLFYFTLLFQFQSVMICISITTHLMSMCWTCTHVKTLLDTRARIHKEF